MGQLKLKKEKELCNVNGNGKQLLMGLFQCPNSAQNADLEYHMR